MNLIECFVQEIKLMNWRINNMKTVMDAVNEFKGEWPYGEPSIVQQLSTGNLDCWHEEDEDALNTGNFRMVCTRKEFNDLVSQLETNFGVCKLTYAKYKRAVTKSTKELQVMDEESNQCKISNLGNLLHNMSCSMDDEDEQNEFGGYASFCWYLADELRKSECAVDTTKLVFTQAMADNGELPVVGMECQFKFQHQNEDEFDWCFVIGKSKDSDWLIFHDKNIESFSHNINKGVYVFKPIDTRTDKEKAIDAACLIIDDSKRCVDANINLDCSAAQKAVIITMINNGYRKVGE